jgi:tRNA (cmo5U34)-methyltransferase
MDWSEENSQTFIDYGRYFVPQREHQIDIICSLLPETARQGHILELCCGEGLLSQAILQRYESCQVTGLDGSPVMLARARERLKPLGQRFTAQHFDLEAGDWRNPKPQFQAVVTSLALHHLDDAGKQQLYGDIFKILSPGGIFLSADLINPLTNESSLLAAQDWEAEVRRRCLEIDGNAGMFERFQETQWNLFRYPDEMDKPSAVTDHLRWLEQAGFENIDLYWLFAGHAIYGGTKSQS